MKELLDGINHKDVLTFVITVVSFIPLLIISHRNKGKGQTFGMWFGWFALDLLQMRATMVQDGKSWVILFGFAVGSLLMSITMFIYKRGWGEFDMIICFFTAISGIIWIYKGPYMAVLMLTITQIVANVEFGLNVWKKPHLQRMSLLSYFGFLVASILTLCDRSVWAMPHILYLGYFTIFECMIIFLIVRSRIKRRVKVFYY